MLKTLRSTLKNTFIYSFGTLASKLVGFFLLPLYTTKLSVSEYGVLGILEITGQFLIALFGLGLFNAFFRWYWDKKYTSRQGSILFTLMSLVLLFSISIVILFWFQDKNISLFLFNSEEYAILVKLMVIIGLLEAQNMLILTLLRLQEKAVFYTFLTVSKFIVQLVVTVYLMAYKGKKIEGIYIGQLFSDILFLLIVSGRMYKYMIFRFETSLIKDLMKFSLPLLLTSILGVILTVTDRYTLKFLGTLKDVGIYALGYKISFFLRTVIVSSVNLALFPVIYKMMNSPNSKRFYSKVMTYYTYGLMFFALGLSFFGKEVVKVMARRVEYWEAFTLIPILTFAIVFSMLRDVSLTGINLAKKTFIIARVVFIVVIINLLLNIITIPIWGYIGAGVTTLFSQMLYFIIIYIFAQRIYFIPFELKKVILILFVGAILVGLSQLGNSFGLITRILYKSILLISFPIILYPFHFYEKIELEKIKEIWKTWRNPGRWKSNLKRIASNDTKKSGNIKRNP